MSKLSTTIDIAGEKVKVNYVILLYSSHLHDPHHILKTKIPKSILKMKLAMNNSPQLPLTSNNTYFLTSKMKLHLYNITIHRYPRPLACIRASTGNWCICTLILRYKRNSSMTITCICIPLCLHTLSCIAYSNSTTVNASRHLSMRAYTYADCVFSKCESIALWWEMRVVVRIVDLWEGHMKVYVTNLNEWTFSDAFLFIFFSDAAMR